MKIFNKQNLSITIISNSKTGLDLSFLLEEISRDLRYKKNIIKYKDRKEGIFFNEKDSKQILIKSLFYNFKELDVNYIDSVSLVKSLTKYNNILSKTDIILINLDKITYNNLENILHKINSLKNKELRYISLVQDSSYQVVYPDICEYLDNINNIIEYSSLEEFLFKLIFIIKNKLDSDNLKQVNLRLKQLSNTDELTGLYNMRAFWNLYVGSMMDCKKSRGSYSVYMLDIDNFKQVNDKYDHLIGSSILAEIGSIFLNNDHITSSDYVARYGGDEYILVKKNTSYEDMMNFAKELVDLFSEHKFEYKPHIISITISLGCVFVESGFSGCDEDPVKIADLLLYKSKIMGKNKFFGTKLQKDENVDLKLEHILKDIKTRRLKNNNEKNVDKEISAENNKIYSIDLNSQINNLKENNDKNNNDDDKNIKSKLNKKAV